ncbi:MAG TPA: hypothetical protein VHB73_05545, partial [Alphaproteobacteria bacterium]|nr:hypothetical protein [Alphaproteobacteria bacterium]
MLAEQDFVLRIRRLHRLNTPCVVVNIIRNLPDYAGNEVVADTAADQLKAAAAKISADTHLMSN